MAADVRKIGLLVNPIAGMGGRVGLKGTDGAQILAQSRALGAKPKACARARDAFAYLCALPSDSDILTVSDNMGENATQRIGLKATIIERDTKDESTAIDTINAVRAFEEQGVELILFAGGDGTARDILGVVGERVPVLGIPSGVKMHSSVFATGPKAAGRLATKYALGDRTGVTLERAEVMDIDEEAQRENRLSARLYGYAQVPFERNLIQSAKAAGRPSEENTLRQLAAEIAREMDAETSYIFGPGTSTNMILENLDLEGTLLGVDVVQNGKIIAKDANEAQMLALPVVSPIKIILGVVGGQGFILGRGNQQISADVIRRAGAENVEFISSIEKLISLEGRGLLIDSGDASIDDWFSGYVGVRTAPDNVAMTKVTAV